jgi:hypothetical protein
LRRQTPIDRQLSDVGYTLLRSGISHRLAELQPWENQVKRIALFASLLSLLLSLFACSSEPAPAADAVPAPTAATPPPSAEALAGRWTGDWGPNANDRNTVTLELKYENGALVGAINPSSQGIVVSRVSYAADTGAITMKAEAKARDGKTVDYTIDGKVEGSSMTGTWKHDDKSGDFKVTKA